jgi:hypothetical protein
MENNLNQLHQLVVGQLFNSKIEIFRKNMSLRSGWNPGRSVRATLYRRCSSFSDLVGRE